MEFVGIRKNAMAGASTWVLLRVTKYKIDLKEVDFMNCKGSGKRLIIVRDYNVVPVAHIQLLEGQTKYSDAEAVIKNDYYIFEATCKADGRKEIIQCGMTAAKDFLRLIQHEGLPVFNPLRQAANNHNEENGQAGKSNGKAGQAWNPTAKQLYNAIMWVIILIDAKPNTPIYEIRADVCKFKDREPFASRVKAVNTIIGKRLKGKTLTEAIEELRAKNDIRDDVCQFDLLTDVINHSTDKEGKPIKPVF